MNHRSHAAKLLMKACLSLATSCCVNGGMHGQSPKPLVSCKPASQKTSDLGCWIVASAPLGVVNAPVYWTLDSFSTRADAERAAGQAGTVVESLGKVWLFTIGSKLAPVFGGTRAAQIGPLPIQPGKDYTAQYMEATLQPGMVSRTHVHSGVEAFYTETGETCLETPQGRQIGRKGVDIVVPEGVPMELTASGTEVRKGLILVLHDSSKAATTVVDWRSKGLCGGLSSLKNQRNNAAR